RPMSTRPPAGRSARDQVTHARARAAQARARAHARMQGRRAAAGHAAGMNFGAGRAVLVFLAALASAGFMYIKRSGGTAPTSPASAAFAGFDNGGESVAERYAARLSDEAGDFTVFAVATPAAAGASVSPRR